MQNITKLLLSFLERRYLYIVFFIVLLFGLSFIFEYFLVGSVEKNWETISKEKVENIILQTQNKFQQYQNSAASSVSGLAARTDILNAILDKNENVLFELLKTYREEGVSYEIFDKTENLLAWSNNFGSNVVLRKFTDNPDSYLNQGTIYSWLIISYPVVRDSSILGKVVLKKLFDVNYPLSNQFISSELFKGTFTKEIDYPISFELSKDGLSEFDSSRISIPLISINNAVLCYAYSDAPTVSVLTDEIKHYMSIVENFLVVFLTLLISIPLVNLIHGKLTGYSRVIFIVAVLWVVRYLWLAANFPFYLISAGIFSPAYFASQFGYGIASSIGEMLITSLFLIASSVVIGQELFKVFYKPIINSKILSVFKIFAVVFVPVIFFLFLRGYMALIISAINDSTLKYNEHAQIIPSFEFLMMLLSLVLISISFVLISVLLTGITYKLFGGFKNKYLQVGLVIVIYVLMSFLYAKLDINPLSDFPERLVIFLSIFGIALLINREVKKNVGKLFFIVIRFVVPVSILLLVMFLNMKTKEDALDKLETYALELSRPIDNWLTFIVDESLNQISTGNVAKSIHDKADIRQSGFTEWASSIVSREGFSSSVTIFDTTGRSLSSFQVGNLQVEKESSSVHQLLRKKSIYVKEGVGGMKHYSGYAPLFTEDSSFIGAVKIDVVASRGELFRNESPEILQASMRNDFKSYYKNVYYSEFENGNRIYSTNKLFSNNFLVPDSVTEYLNSNNHQSYTVTENLDGKEFKTIYVKLPDGPNRIIAINAESLEIQWDIFNILKLSLFLIAISLLLLLPIIMIVNRKKYFISYRAKILTAFLIVSIIPIGIAAYFNREFAVTRTQELIKISLEDETALISHYLSNYQKSKLSSLNYSLSDSLCRSIAAFTGVDFNYYIYSELGASSKPELFDAELIDRRLSPEAYRNIFLLGKTFDIENQTLGTLRYLIGYRVIYNEQHEVAGIIAVPTLFKQSAVDEELKERNAYFFGAYSIVVVLALVLGSVFANQISKPVRRLTEATRRVGEGELDYRITSGRTDEFGKLEDAFNEMTKEIQQKRVDLIRYEKELAWKEMAKQVAHEIKNPLTPIKLAIQHLWQAHKDGVSNFGDILKNSVEMVNEQIETLNRIASEFSNFARMPERRLVSCNVGNVLHDSVQLFTKYENVEIKLDAANIGLIINADQEELRRAFINILRNSIQAMNERGVLTVSAKVVDKNVTVEFSDDGSGIPEEIKDRIFEPNFSTKTDGMGLGLAIVKKTIDDLNGKITFSSEKGKGTIFIVQIPASE
jgi:two-component system nitrogen regulation sensor histidine kinase NtrY